MRPLSLWLKGVRKVNDAMMLDTLLCHHLKLKHPKTLHDAVLHLNFHTITHCVVFDLNGTEINLLAQFNWAESSFPLFLGGIKSSSLILEQNHQWFPTTRRPKDLTFPACSEGGCFCGSAASWWKVRCAWKHWPGQPDPAGPVSADLRVSGFPPVFTWNLLFSGHAQHDTRARVIPTRPADREARRARSLDSLRDLYLCNIPPLSKTTARLSFCFPSTACLTSCGCRHLSTAGSDWNVEASASFTEK